MDVGEVVVQYRYWRGTGGKSSVAGERVLGRTIDEVENVGNVVRISSVL